MATTQQSNTDYHIGIEFFPLTMDRFLCLKADGSSLIGSKCQTNPGHPDGQGRTGYGSKAGSPLVANVLEQVMFPYLFRPELSRLPVRGRSKIQGSGGIGRRY